VDASVATVVELAEVNQVLGGLYPGAYGYRVGNTWVLCLQKGQVYSILEGEFDVRVVQLQRPIALCEIVATIQAELASGRLDGPSPVLLEIPVVGVGTTGGMCGVVDGVPVVHRLVVSVNHGDHLQGGASGTASLPVGP